MKTKFIDAYIDVAKRFSELSTAKRLHVGAVIVKDDSIIGFGYNGMPSGWWTNECEYVEKTYDSRDTLTGDFCDWNYDKETKVYSRLKTKPEVLHAESNAIAKLARSTQSGVGAWMFCTHAPCLECAKLIYQSGITNLVYVNDYRTEAGINFLLDCKIEIEKHESNTD